MPELPHCPTCGGPLYAERETYDHHVGTVPAIEVRCLHCGRLVAEQPLGPDILAEARALAAERSRRGRPRRKGAG